MTTYTKEETAANRKAWTDALRSGEYTQGRNALTTDDGYCCLGVACELTVRNGVAQKVDNAYGHAAEFFWDDASTVALPRAVFQWLGITPDGDLTHGIEYAPHGDGGALIADNLVNLNDDAGYTFEQIADVIDAGLVKLNEDVQ